MTKESDAAVRVLVVDDHADVRFLVGVLLRDAGLELAGEAASAEAAVQAVEDVAPDAVVLDALMPVVDGFEAAQRILARRPGLPILLCSGVVDDEIRARARAAGIAACLPKDEFDRIPAVVLELVGRA
jgi:CheY-like chemotaxis protein